MITAEESRRLLQVGRRGIAMVMAVRDTGERVAQNPETELQLCIALDGQETYKITHRQVIRRIAIGSRRPGGRVPIRVDPRNPANVLVAWRTGGLAAVTAGGVRSPPGMSFLGLLIALAAAASPAPGAAARTAAATPGKTVKISHT